MTLDRRGFIFGLGALALGRLAKKAYASGHKAWPLPGVSATSPLSLFEPNTPARLYEAAKDYFGARASLVAFLWDGVLVVAKRGAGTYVMPYRRGMEISRGGPDGHIRYMDYGLAVLKGDVVVRGRVK